MKRSEMLKKLCEPIEIEGVDLMLWPNEAEAILRRIEELGMLPPISNIIKSIDAEMPALGRGKFNYQIETNEWESEE